MNSLIQQAINNFDLSDITLLAVIIGLIVLLFCKMNIKVKLGRYSNARKRNNRYI